MALMEDARSRKLAPIYSALESGNWRQAIRLCEKRDVEKWLTTKALKANGLWRMGRFDEALQLCLEVQATLPGKWTQELLDSLSKLPTAGPTDEDTLAAMSFNYRMMNRRDEVTSMFEAAVKARPADSSLLKELFMCHVRAKHYLKAQQTATKLHKLDPQGGKYIVWAAATMLLQSERGEGVAGTKTMLPLAERMAVKVLQEKAGRGCRPVGEELRLYLEILKLQGKHRESLEALEKFEPPPGEASTGGAAGDIEDESSLENGTIVHMQELERMELKAELYEKLGSDSDFAQAEIIWRDLLRRVPDQWSYYTALLDLTEKRYGLTRCMQGASSAEWITPLTSIWQLIRDIQPQHSRLRGPFLAEMELLKRSVAWFGGGCRPPSLAEADKAGSDPAGSSTPDEGEAETLVDALCRCLERYVSTFSPKLCCFHDIRPYLAVFLAVGDGTLSEDLIPGLNNLKVFFRREADESRVSDEEACSPRKPGGDGDPPALGQGERDAGAKRLHRYICACQARRFLRDFMVSDGNPEGGEGEGDGVRDVEDGDAVEETAKRYRQVAHDLTLQYRATLHLNHGSEGGQREVQHGDELVLLAARLLLRLCELYDHRARCGDATSESKAYLVRVEVICLLEAALSCSPYNHYMKILAIDVYWQLGSFARGIALFNNLDVKQIQVDTLSYLIVEPSHSLGMFTESQAQCRGIRMVHRNCQNETAEHVARAFDRGNYSKGAEMDRFQREKLDRSLQLALAKAEKVAMDVVTDQQTYISAARHLQEDALSDDGGGVSFPGDAWLEGQVENMDYSVQADRCWFRSPEDEAAIGKSRRADLLASLKIRLLANNAMLVALKGDPASEVDKVVKRLEGAVAAATRIQHGKKGASTTLVDEKEAPNGLGAATASMAKMKVSGAGAVWFEMSELPWRLFAETSRALALVHQGIGEDSDALASATEAMRRAVEHAKACRRILKESGRHICTLEGGASKGKQNEVPLRPEWIRAWSNWVANGGVYTCLLLQALGAELPADKKKGGKSKGKGKAKGKGKSVTSSAAGAGGEAGGTSSDIPRAQDALSALGAEVTGLLRGLVTALKSETSAKGDPSDPGDTLAQLLKGEMGVTYQAAIGVLWGAAADRWFKDDKAVQRALAGIGSGQATSCQRLLAVASQHLSTLQRWER